MNLKSCITLYNGTILPILTISNFAQQKGCYLVLRLQAVSISCWRPCNCRHLSLFSALASLAVWWIFLANLKGNIVYYN